MRRVWAIARKTVRQRGRGNVVFLVLVQPILFCVVWGLCVSLELTDARVVLYAPRGGAEPRTVARALAATGVLLALHQWAGLAPLFWLPLVLYAALYNAFLLMLRDSLAVFEADPKRFASDLAETHRRLAEAYDALGRADDARALRGT